MSGSDEVALRVIAWEIKKASHVYQERLHYIWRTLLLVAVEIKWWFFDKQIAIFSSLFQLGNLSLGIINDLFRLYQLIGSIVWLYDPKQKANDVNAFR